MLDDVVFGEIWTAWLKENESVYRYHLDGLNKIKMKRR